MALLRSIGGATVTYEEASRLILTTDGLTSAQVAEIMKVTGERVGQIWFDAFNILKATVEP